MANEISFEEFNAKYAPKQQDTEISFDDFNAKYAQEKQVNNKEQDYPLTRGYVASKASVSLAESLATHNYDEAAKNIAEQARYAKANPGSEESVGLQKAWKKGDGILGGIANVAGEIASDYQKADGAIAGAKSLAGNAQAMGSGIVAQMPNMVLPMAGMVGGGLSGSTVSPVIGTILGAWAGASTGNALVGTSEAAMRQLEKAGINPEDTEAVKTYLKKNSGSILGETAVKGGVIGAVDTATMGLTHFILTGPGKAAADRALAKLGVDTTDHAAVSAAAKTPQFKSIVASDPVYIASKKGAGNAARNIGAASLEPVGEFTGEYAGSKIATGEADAKDAFLEAASSLGQSGATFAGQKLYAGAKYPLQSGTTPPPNTSPPGSPPPPDIASSSNVDELISATKSSIDVELDNQTNQDLLDEISASNNAASSNAPVDQGYVPQPDTEPRPTINIAPDVQPLIDNAEPLVSGQAQPIIEQSQPTDLNVNPVQASQEPQPTEGATNGTAPQYADPMLDSGSASSTSANPSGSDGNSVLRYDAGTGAGGIGLPGTVVETDGARGAALYAGNEPSDIGLGGKTQSLARDSSWVIRNKETGEVIMETFDKAKVDALNTIKYEAVPILQYMQGLNTLANRSQPTVNSDFTHTPASISATFDVVKGDKIIIGDETGKIIGFSNGQPVIRIAGKTKVISIEDIEGAYGRGVIEMPDYEKRARASASDISAGTSRTTSATLQQSPSTPLPASAPKEDIQTSQPVKLPTENIEAQALNDRAVAVKNAIKGSYDILINQKSSVRSTAGYKKMLAAVEGVMETGNGNAKQFKLYSSGYKKSNPEVSKALSNIAKALELTATPKPLELHYTVEFDAAKLGLNAKDYKSENELSIAIAEAEQNLTAQGKAALEALLLEDQFDAIFGEKLTEQEINSWLSLLDNNEENDNSTTQGTTESGVTEGTQSGEQDRDAEAQGKDQSQVINESVATVASDAAEKTAEVINNDSTPTPIAQDRVAESANDMFEYLKKSEGGIVHKGKILYPAIKVIGMPGIFQWRNGSVKKITDGGIGIKNASEDESNDVIDALEKDQAQVVLNSSWGGSGKDTDQKSVSVLHNPKGMEYKHKDDWLDRKAKTPTNENSSKADVEQDQVQEPKPQPESKPADELTKAKEHLDAAGIKGNERLAAIAAVRSGANTAEDIAEAHGVDVSKKAENVDTSEERVKESGESVQDESPKFSKSSPTINIDGVERSRLNSDGKPIANSDESLRNFWEWFGGSQVIDEQGRPQLMYHGTNKDFDTFDVDKLNTGSGSYSGKGFYFTPSIAEAGGWADQQGDNHSVIPAYIKMINPHQVILRNWNWQADNDFSDRLKANGHDGTIVKVRDIDTVTGKIEDEWIKELVVFNPNQIKSATGNNGNFSKSDNNILKSKSPDTTQNTHTVASATSAMLEAHTGKIKSVLQAMLDNGKAKVVTAEQAAGIVGEDAMSSDAQAFYNPADKVTYFVADQIPTAYTAQEFKGLVLHEIAVHAKELGKDSKEFKSILAQVDMMRKAGNKAITAAFERVPKDTSPEHVTEEALAYAVQHYRQLGITQRVLSWFRNAIRAIGKSFPTLQKMKLHVWANSLSENDLRFMAESALRNSERSGVQNESDTPQFSKQGNTININGVERPRLNSNGKPIANSDEAIRNFYEWFGDSKIVNADGAPMVVYHWSEYEFTEFDMSRSGEGAHFGTKKAAIDRARGMAGIGYEIEEEDGKYFVVADSGKNADEWQGPFNTKKEAISFRSQQPKHIEPMEIYLNINNLVRLPDHGTWGVWDILRSLPDNTLSTTEKTGIMDSNERYAKMRETLQSKGIDGFVYRNEVEDKGRDSYIVLSPNQVKSAIGNNGNFSKSDNNILFSKNTNPITHPFQPENSGKPLDSWIKIFTRNQIVTLYRDSLIGKKLEEYKELRERVTADTNSLFEKADNFLLELRQIPKGLRDAFASLAHDSTLNNVDPSNPIYVPSPDAVKLANYLTKPSNQKLAAKIKKRLNSMEAAHKKLHAEFNALPAKEQELFKKLRSKYTEQMTMVFDEFKNRIGRMKNIDPAIKASSVKKLDEQLTDLLGRVYFPLYRAGNYIVKAEKAGEPTTVDHVESNFAADRLEKKLKKLGYTVSRSTRIVSPQDNKSGEALNAVRDLLDKAALKGKIEGAALSQLMDDIDQTILQSLPDQSYRKSFIHRKGTKGYSDDFIRAYADAMRRGSINIANLRHGDKITTVIEDMRKDVKTASKVPGSNVAALNQVVDRVEQIEVDIRNPTSKLVSVSGKIAFAQMLGSLSNFILNITQTPLLTMPHLGAEYGYGKANLQLSMAYAKQMRSLKKQGTLSELGKWLDMRHGLVGNELDLMQQLHDSGALDLTQSFDLIDAANNPSYQENELSMNFMKVIALPQHVSEIVNRQVTALATIRLEMARSGSPLKAYHAARKAIDQTHFNYCVDLETECLTTDGWKKQSDIKVGDIAMSVDDEGRAVESSITEINIFKGGHTAHHFSHSNRRFSMVVTPDHDCLAQSYCSRERKWYGIKKIKARDLCGSHHLLRTPLKAIDGRDDYLGEDFAALLGWIAAEGHYAKFRNCKENKDVRLHQSDSHNPEYVKEIRGILTRLGGEFKEYTRKQDKVLMWVISGDLRKKIIDIMPHKVLTFEMAKKMPAKEMMAVLLSFAKGDGYFMDECKSSCVIGQKTGKNSFNLEVLQSMAIQCGLSSARHAGDSVRQTLMVNFAKSEIGRSNKRSMVKTLKKEIITVDTVWCPTTENGKWIARRNGAVFVTGNSKENRAKLMTGNTQSILFRFKQYAQQAAFLFVHTAKLALNGSTKLDSDGNKLDGTRPSERTKARKQLAGMLGMQILVAGTLGLPVFAEAAVAASGVAGFKLAGSTGAYVGVAGAMIVAAALAFGDDDGEEFDVEVKKWFIKHFGEGVGSSLADGVIPRGLASRLNASELVIRRPEEARNSTDFANQWMISLLGAFLGGTVYNAGVGLKDIVEGDTAKGATKLIPVKAIKDLVTSWKWANDGMNVTNKDGEIITPVSKADIFFKSIGINPTSVVNAREYENAKHTLHNALLKKQQKALTAMRNETDKTKRFDAIIKYNKSAPLGYEIDSDKVRGVIAREIKYKGKPNVVTGNPVQEDYLNKNTRELRPAY